MIYDDEIWDSHYILDRCKSQWPLNYAHGTYENIMPILKMGSRICIFALFSLMEENTLKNNSLLL